MTTICSCCGLNLTGREQENERFVPCPKCNHFTAKGVHSYRKKITNERREDKMEKPKAVKQKTVKPASNKVKLKEVIQKMLSEGKTNDDIIEKTGCSKAYLYKIKTKRIK